MACILLTDMDPPTSSPTAHHNGLLPDLDSATGADPKQDTDVTCLTVHLYCLGKDGGEGGADGSASVLTFPSGEYVAEELCISAAKACGESQEDFSSDVCPHTQNIVCFIDMMFICTAIFKTSVLYGLYTMHAAILGKRGKESGIWVGLSLSLRFPFNKISLHSAMKKEITSHF